MEKRSFGVTALDFSSVMIGLYCQFAAIALILLGSTYVPTGSQPAAITLVLGTTFLGLTFAAYFVGYGLWMGKHWSWAGAIALLGVFAGASLALSVLSSNYLSTLVPIVVAAIGVWSLNRPAIRAELLGEAATERQTKEVAEAPEGLEAAEPAH